jgi:hypothetical protein
MMKNRSIKALGIVWLCLIMITACGQKKHGGSRHEFIYGQVGM